MLSPTNNNNIHSAVLVIEVPTIPYVNTETVVGNLRGREVTVYTPEEETSDCFCVVGVISGFFTMMCVVTDSSSEGLEEGSATVCYRSERMGRIAISILSCCIVCGMGSRSIGEN